MHTQAFIDEMKQRLTEERQALLSELREESHESNGEYEANFPQYGRSEEENASEIEEYQSLVATTSEAKKRLEEVEAALFRIENGMYGTTEDGKQIPEDRLRANPAATTVIS